jgi:hypothetical protein
MDRRRRRRLTDLGGIPRTAPALVAPAQASSQASSTRGPFVATMWSQARVSPMPCHARDHRSRPAALRESRRFNLFEPRRDQVTHRKRKSHPASRRNRLFTCNFTVGLTGFEPATAGRQFARISVPTRQARCACSDDRARRAHIRESLMIERGAWSPGGPH